MDHTAVKKAVLKAVRTRLEDIAVELKERITELRSVTVGDDNAETASQTESTRGSDVDVLNALGEQYNHVLADLERVGTLDPADHPGTIGFGSVVHTDQRNFFVGASLDEFDAMGQRYLGVTPMAPVVHALLGCRPGDTVAFGGTDYRIAEVF